MYKIIANNIYNLKIKNNAIKILSKILIKMIRIQNLKIVF